MAPGVRVRVRVGVRARVRVRVSDGGHRVAAQPEGREARGRTRAPLELPHLGLG